MKERCQGTQIHGEEAPQGIEGSTKKQKKLAKKDEESDDLDANSDSDF